jgi:hypothetical protein
MFFRSFMSSRIYPTVFLIFSLLLMGPIGCGKFGEKKVSAKYLTYTTGTEGCLNSLPEQVTKFSSGALTAVEWEGTWRCAIENLELFRKFVLGQNPEGFSPEDLQILTNRFLLTQSPVSLDVIEFHLELKEIFMGGSKDLMTYEEFDYLIELIKKIGPMSATLLPHLANRMHAPTQVGTEKLVETAATFIDDLNDIFKLSEKPLFSWERLNH